MAKLGVNIDHVATLRQARRGEVPDPVEAAKICEQAGAQSIVCHLREDRRHIQDDDVRRLRKMVQTRLNLEMSLSPEIIAMAGRIRPDQATLVPERRQEITTEGGLDVVRYYRRVKEAVTFLQSRKIAVSLFIDPHQEQIDAAQKCGAKMIELHTGAYSLAKAAAQRRALQILGRMTVYAADLGLVAHAGHGLNYDNTSAVAGIKQLDELNIGHAIISRSVFVGLEQAVRQMRALVESPG